MPSDISGWREGRETGDGAIGSTEIRADYSDDEGKDMTVKIYKHKFIPNLSVVVHNKKKAENKPNKKQIVFKAKVKKIIEINTKKCVLCGNEYNNPKYGKPYCDKHKSEDASRWTFEPNEKKK